MLALEKSISPLLKSSIFDRMASGAAANLGQGAELIDCTATQDACSGAWHKQELFLATPSEVHCILIAATDEAAEPYIEVKPPANTQPC